jgi:hypothetical protein
MVTREKLMNGLAAVAQIVAIAAATFAWHANAEMAVMERRIDILEAQAAANSKIQETLVGIQKDIEYQQKTIESIERAVGKL